jgi:hypothetical protein
MSRGTLALLVAALAIGAYVYFVEIRGDEREQAAESAEKRFVGVAADDLVWLDLPLEGGGRARVVRAGDTWRIESPLQAAADDPRVDRIATALAELESRSVIEDVEDLGLFGLGPDGLAVEFSANGESRTLVLGKETPFGDQLYAALVADPTRVYTVSAFTRDSLEPTLTDLRDKRMTTLAPEDVETVTVTSGGEQIVTLSRDEESWRLTAPIEAAGDARRIDRLLQDLSLARASAFVDEPEDLAAYGLDAPMLEIELGGAETRERLALGEAEEKAYARRNGEGPVFEVIQRTLDQVPVDRFAYRYKTVLKLASEQIRQLEFHFPRDDVSHSFVRDDDGWRPADEALTVDVAKLDDLMFALEELEASGLEGGDADRAALGLDPPVARVVALDAAGTELGWLELGDPQAGVGTPALSSASDQLWFVVNDIAESVPLGREAFENRWQSGVGENLE